MSTVVEVLRRGRELYASAPSHVADPGIPERGTYCVLTATQAAAYELGGSEDAHHKASLADDYLQRVAQTMRLVNWNAENSTETVLEAWDRAIAAAEAKA